MDREVHDVFAIEEAVFDPLGPEILAPLVLPWPSELNELAEVRKVSPVAIELKLEVADEVVSPPSSAGMGEALILYPADFKDVGTD